MAVSHHRYGGVDVYSTPLVPGDNRRAGARERERAAVEAILTEVFGAGTCLGHRPDGSPYLPDYPGLCISLSHSARMAVVAVSRGVDAGVDVEEPREALLRIADRFLTSEERAHYSGLPGLLMAWTLKEAAYKALRPEIPATEMPVPPADLPYIILYTDPHPDSAESYLSVVAKR